MEMHNFAVVIHYINTHTHSTLYALNRNAVAGFFSEKKPGLILSLRIGF